MNRIGVHLIYGANPEPFLEAALRSVAWADYVCAVNTALTSPVARANEQVIVETVPEAQLRRGSVHMPAGFDFAYARNHCLSLATPGDYVLILDSDDVHYPEFEQMARDAVAQGHDMITAHFWHLIGYKDLWGEEPHREILFTKTPGTRFTKSVHEGIEHPRQRPYLLPDYHYVHYGYIKPPQEIFKRWVLYSQIEGDPHHYDGRNPDDALAGWLDNTQPFWRDHPPAAAEALWSYPCAPRSARALPEGTPRNVGLVLLTWNDIENLRPCLKSLAYTRQPFKLIWVDNGSDDGTVELIEEWATQHSALVGGDTEHTVEGLVVPGLSLAQALNRGFRAHLLDPEIDYIGWIHPDMVFEHDTWLECLRHALDTHPDLTKVGAAELDAGRQPEPWPGNSQCYLIRRSALEQVGLFDENFEACGGYEDWDMNNRLLGLNPRTVRPELASLSSPGRVMIWPDALVRHNAMGTRSQHDNVEAGRRNADYYRQIWDTWSPAV